MLLCEQAQPEILAGVGVLIFVDEDIFEARLILFKNVAVRFQDDEHVQQQVAEIAGVERFEPRLIEGIEMLALAVGPRLILTRVEIGGGEAAVLPPVDQAGEQFGRPAFVVEAFGRHQLFDDAQLVVGVEDGEIAVQPDEFGVAAQHLGGDAVEGAEPRHPLHRVADHLPDPMLHLARGAIGEGDGEDLGWPGAARGDQMCQTRGERRRLARARACQHQHRAVGRQHRLALRRVEAGEVGGIGGGGGD